MCIVLIFTLHLQTDSMSFEMYILKNFDINKKMIQSNEVNTYFPIMYFK